MQRRLLSGVVWFMLVAVPLHSAAALFSQNSPQPLSFDPALAWQQARRDVSDRLFEDTACVSDLLSMQCKQQSKELFAQVRGCKTPPVKQQQSASHLRSASVPTSLPIRFFLHRKVAPPATTDDPFLR